MSEIDQLKKELEEIKQELAAQVEGSRAYRALKRDEAEVQAQLIGAGAIAQGDGAVAAGEGATVIQESIIVNAEKGARVVIGTEPVKMSSKMRATALGRYLEHIIAHNRYLQLQGIRSGGKLVNIELEHIYITLRTTQQQTIQAEENWLHEEAGMAPGEMGRMKMERSTLRETVSVTVDQALADNKHMVILGDPGSGKTTLLRYLALLYGRDLAESAKSVSEKLELNEAGYLPVLLQLRQFGSFLKEHRSRDDGTEGHGVLLEFLFRALKGFRIDLPDDFFDEYFQNGKAIILLDGMDEVGDPNLRARVARMVEAFTLAYPKCRFVITSRVVGYTGASRLTGDYATTTVQDFALEDIRQFLTHWHRLVAIGQIGAGEDAEIYARGQTEQLLSAIENNERVCDLAINPLMLTVIALVHRDRVKLPDRRAELYAEAVDVLLGKFDEARGVDEIRILDDRPFDAGDRRLLLQNLALYMHEHQKKELEGAELRSLLQSAFKGMTKDESEARRAADRFLIVVEERTGLLLARGENIYAFSHLTFQEYLAALAIAARNDYVEYILKNSGEGWWREVILLTAGYLSTQSKERTTKLVRAIAEQKVEPTPYHNLALAIECIQDVTENRVDFDLMVYIKKSGWDKLREPFPTDMKDLLRYVKVLPSYINFYFKTKKYHKYEPAAKRDIYDFVYEMFDPLFTKRLWLEYRTSIATALTQAGIGHWSFPFGEPEWITIPAGKFWMGSENDNGLPLCNIFLSEYKISITPITNYQYRLFEKNSGYKSETSKKKEYPKKLLAHVAIVSAVDALNYCEWLSQKTGKKILLPSEAEWEKAARGHIDKRTYPWGEWENARCNSSELGLYYSLPVGIFPEGASPYKVLDMVGNESEWTRTHYHKRNEEITSPLPKFSDWLTLKGGQFFDNKENVRCSYRDDCLSNDGWFSFRVVAH